MSGMRLRRPCEHVDDDHPDGHYEPHNAFVRDSAVAWHYEDCPGGEFLPEDAANRMHSVIRMYFPDLNDYAVQLCAKDLFDALVADQVGEPG